MEHRPPVGKGLIELLESAIPRNSPKLQYTVWDPFLGTGTTGVACAKSLLQFYGGDIDEHLVIDAKKRIKNAYQVATGMFQFF